MHFLCLTDTYQPPIRKGLRCLTYLKKTEEEKLDKVFGSSRWLYFFKKTGSSSIVLIISFNTVILLQ